MNLSRGFRCKLEEHIKIQQEFQVSMKTFGSAVYDICCFGVDQEEKLSDDRYMIFYNQPTSPDGAITLTDDGAFTISLPLLPPNIVKLVFTVSIDGDQTMGEIKEHVVQISQGGNQIMGFSLNGADFHNERAIISIEIYLKTVWRLHAAAKGFDGGLEALLDFYGGEALADEPAPQLSEEKTSLEKPAAPTVSSLEKPAQKMSGGGNASGNKPISLKKGEKVSLKKEDGKELHKVIVGLGWDMAKVGTSIDCDASAFLCKNGKLGRSSDDVVCYTNLTHKSGAVRHKGDNLTGAGSGDDEQIFVDLDQLPPEYDRIVFVVNIFLAKISRQHFGMVKNCFIRICDGKGKEMWRYNLSENYDKMTAMIFGEVQKENGTWMFHAIGEGTKDGSITALRRRFR